MAKVISKVHRVTSHLPMEQQHNQPQHNQPQVTNHHRVHILRVVPRIPRTVVTKEAKVVPVVINLVDIHLLLLLHHQEVEDTNKHPSPSRVTTKLPLQITNNLHRVATAIQEVAEVEEEGIKVVVVVVVDTLLSQDTLVEVVVVVAMVVAVVDIEEGMYCVSYLLSLWFWGPLFDTLNFIRVYFFK